MNAQNHPEVEGVAYGLMLSQLLSHTASEQSAEEAASRTKTVYLDARERNEYEVSHIDGAIWVGYDDFDMQRLEGLSRDTSLIVYCSVGYRSEKIAEILEKAGYTDVVNLYGGIFDWVNKGYEVVDEKGSTNRVHAYDKSWGVWLKKAKKVY